MKKSVNVGTMRGTFQKWGHTAFVRRNILPLNMKRRRNVYEGSLNTIFFAKLNLIMSFSIFKSLRKNGEFSAVRLWSVSCDYVFECGRCYWVGNSSQIKHISLLQKNNVATAKIIIFQNEHLKFSKHEKWLY